MEKCTGYNGEHKDRRVSGETYATSEMKIEGYRFILFPISGYVD
jgi:hypothetical protein